MVPETPPPICDHVGLGLGSNDLCLSLRSTHRNSAHSCPIGRPFVVGRGAREKWASCLVCPVPSHDNVGGSQEDFQVKPECLGRSVLQVHFNHLVKCNSRSSTYLPYTGYPGLNGKPFSMPWFVTFQFIEHGRPGTDKTHLAEQDVKKLR